MSSLLNVSPGMMPRFFSQKIAANEPEKKIPSTAANAHSRSPYVALLLFIHFIAQSAFLFTHGSVSMALNRNSLQCAKFTMLSHDYVSVVYFQSIQEFMQIQQKNILTLTNLLNC